MNSLTELNNFSKIGVPFQDDRPETYIFDRETPTDMNFSEYENDPVFSTPGINVTSIYSRTVDAKLTVDTSSLSNVVVSWGTLPANFTVTNPSPGVYTVDGIRGVYDWSLVSTPAITFPLNSNSFSYTSTFTYGAGLTKTWNSNVDVVQFEQLLPASNYKYDIISSPLFGTPTVSNIGNVALDNSLYSIAISSIPTTAIGNVWATGTGGTVSWSNPTKTLTITGNLSVVNAYLGNVVYAPPTTTFEDPFTMHYELTNVSEGNFVSTADQTCTSLAAEYLTTPATVFYSRSTEETVLGYAQITDLSGNVLSTYTANVYSFNANAIFSITSAGTGGSSVFSTINKKLTLVGTKSEVNSHLATLVIQPAKDYIDTFDLAYSVTMSSLPVPVTSSKLQSWACTNTTADCPYDELSTPAPSTYFVGDTPTKVNNPLILNINKPYFVPSAYTLLITPSEPITSLTTAGSLGGTYSYNPTTSEVTLTGSRDQINSHLNSLYLLTSNLPSIGLTYTLTNPSYPLVTSEIQTITNNVGVYSVSGGANPVYYAKNVLSPITNIPTILNNAGNQLETWTVEVQPWAPVYDLIKIEYLVSAGTGGASTFNNTTKTLTITGTLSQINSHLTSVSLQPGLDFVGTVYFKNVFTTVSGIRSIRQSWADCNNTDTALINAATSRTFLKNTAGQIVFTSLVPSIVETVSGASYELTLSSTIGYFGSNESNLLATYIYTGNKEQVNAHLTAIKFWPTKDVTGAQTFTMSLKRNSTSIRNVTPMFTGSGTGSVAGVGVYTFTFTQTFVPTYEQKNYLLADVYMGGGAGGGSGTISNHPSYFYDYTAQGGYGGVGGTLAVTNQAVTGNCSITVGSIGVTSSSNLEAVNGLSYYTDPGLTAGGDTTITGGLTLSVGGGSVAGGANASMPPTNLYLKAGDGGNMGAPQLTAGGPGSVISLAGFPSSNETAARGFVSQTPILACWTRGMGTWNTAGKVMIEFHA